MKPKTAQDPHAQNNELAEHAVAASDQEVKAATKAFLAKYRRALERLGTC